ncbi:uncharacterized protein V2V93DRAFT_368876 [Kockiozyma suomiensis]|uniref:uncharacterized protein n=1 Tax=Kockiozyma suomiensis TaxID=1337062 RepID=UPI0033441F87
MQRVFYPSTFSTRAVLAAAARRTSVTPVSQLSVPAHRNAFSLRSYSTDEEVPASDRPRRRQVVRCYVCGEIGHMASACPKRTNDGNPTIICYNCKESGHISRDCPHPRQHIPDRSKVRCFTCGKTGHISTDCPEGIKCFVCGQIGHVSATCPQRTTIVCFTCGEEGHKASQCPKRYGSKTDDEEN